MSGDDHLRAFVEESRESIDSINDGLLALESDPTDEAAMDSVFRAAHTVKGNAAAMGFEEVSSLAHALEDLLDEVRSGGVEVTGDLVDLLFEGVDALESVLSEVGEHGEAKTDTATVRERLRSVVDEGATTANGVNETGAVRVPDDAPSGPLVRATVTVGEEMPGVDAVFVLQAADEAFEDVVSVPDRDAVEDGEFDSSFHLFVPEDDADVAADGLRAVSKVESVTAERVDDGAPVDGAGTDANDEATVGDGASTATEERRPDTDGSRDDSINSVRVDVERLDDLYGMVEQLVTSRIRLRKTLEDAGVGDAEAIDQLDKLTENLQNTVMDVRLVPLKRVIRTFPRLVRDTARELDKEVAYETEGADVELDRTILTEIRDPLVHIIRNSLDHGIEPPDEREAAGKPRQGTVRLTATRERDHVTIRVADDGAGLDADALLNRAVERGVVDRDEADAMTDSEAYDLIFEPGFSTTEEVTDVSGRGVGMDVVKSTVTQLDGSVSVESTPGDGTTVTLRLPVTMAIVKTMFVRAGSEVYGVPVKNVDEVSRGDDVEVAHGDEVVRHGGSLYPVVELEDVLDVPEPTALADGGLDEGDSDAGDDDAGMLLRIREEQRAVALKCDRVVEQEEVVVKPLEGVLSGTPGLGGTAILGDGEIIPILDVTTL
jgi:two-component system chemotaxis sensor kinase CheA